MAHLRISRVQNPQELGAASQVVKRQYVKRGIMKPHDRSGLEKYQEIFLDRGLTLIVWDEEVAVATVSLLPRSLAGKLPVESVFPEEVGILIEQGHVLGEVTQLASDENFLEERGLSFKERWRVVLDLQRSVCRLAKETELIDTMCVGVHPKNKSHYARNFGFRDLGNSRVATYPNFEDAKTVLLGTELSNPVFLVAVNQSQSLAA